MDSDLTKGRIAELEEKVEKLTSDMKKLEVMNHKLESFLGFSHSSADNSNQSSDAKPVQGNTAANGEFKAYEVFPAVVWLKIASKLEALQDWINLCSTSMQLRNLVKGKAFFNKVLPAIINLTSPYLSRKDYINLHGAFPEIRHPVFYLMTNYFKGSQLLSKIPQRLVKLHLSSPEQIDELAQELEDGFLCQKSPIPFIPRFEGSGPEFERHTMAFLEKFGNRVWFLHMRFQSPNRGVIARALSRKVIDYLKLTPNITGLWLVAYHYGDPDFPEAITDPSSIPHFPNLKYLNLFGANCPHFLRRNSGQLMGLSLHEDRENDQHFMCGQLNRLELTIRTGRNIPLDLHRYAGATLTSVRIELCPETYRDVTEILQKCSSVSESLKDLEIYFLINCRSRNDEEDMKGIIDINLPKLERLQLNNHTGQLTFLIAIPSLQVLELDNQWHDYKEDGSFKMVWGNLGILESNFWKLLPKLELFKLKSKFQEESSVFTRKQFNRLQ